MPFINIDTTADHVSLTKPLPVQEMSGSSNLTIIPSSTKTASGNTVEFDVSNYSKADAFLDITAASGTSPTLNVKFQTKDPVSGKWFDISGFSFTQQTAVGQTTVSVTSGLGTSLRCVYTIGGTTPSFTFSVGMVVKK